MVTRETLIKLGYRKIELPGGVEDYSNVLGDGTTVSYIFEKNSRAFKRMEFPPVIREGNNDDGC
jgi:hypothetical protein